MIGPICRCLALGLVFSLAAAAMAAPAKFLGANSCASSSCHGGGGANQNQFLVWSLKDFHSQRPVAMLETARARQIADAAGIADPMTDERCTTCHEPLRDVPKSRRGPAFNPVEGVSCESCHSPAGNWVRSHTRTDYTRADRTAAGMRDLENLYVRANTCVACHQVVSPALLRAGHPELMFELDGQCVAEPKHWSAAKNGNGTQAWFVGQAVALREMSWELSRQSPPDQNEIARWRALAWLMRRAAAADPPLPAPPKSDQAANADIYNLMQAWADRVARTAAARTWTPALSHAELAALAAASADFRGPAPQPLQARRAGRLVLALDRLLPQEKKFAPGDACDKDLNRLFALAQSVPDFDPAQFARALDEFRKGINRMTR
ncbi:MAG: hypothetical protein KGR98_04315 [Verrucomicrobia bacterium]|nr:hypothetical protein [Verrucomicrobiota bacterium]MDE3099898.1 hypothetical protein [Verrucomicrobiota bacterium]